MTYILSWEPYSSITFILQTATYKNVFGTVIGYVVIQSIYSLFIDAHVA